MSDDFKRVGIALTEPRGPTGRRDEYGIFRLSEAYGHKIDPPALYVRYEGYREQREDGEAMVGLPLGGPNWRPQPLRDFHPGAYEIVRFFDES
jgi:hypothetical protein